jgi:transcriptional regulator with XRE-family HTH domain
MDEKIPTNRWQGQQQSAGMTNQGFIGSLGVVAANEQKKKPKYPEFGARLIAGLARTGLKPKTIVDELKVDPETVRLWMRGERMPRDTQLKKLAKMIGVEAADLRYGPKSVSAFPQLRGEHVTNEDELALLRAYRGLGKEWMREAVRRRTVELLEEFNDPSAGNPMGKRGTQ